MPTHIAYFFYGIGAACAFFGTATWHLRRNYMQMHSCRWETENLPDQGVKLHINSALHLTLYLNAFGGRQLAHALVAATGVDEFDQHIVDRITAKVNEQNGWNMKPRQIGSEKNDPKPKVAETVYERLNDDDTVV